MEQHTSSGAKPIGIILANTGSPAAPTPEAVRDYLTEFLMDDRIIQMPRPFWRFLINHMVLPKRQYTSAEHYQLVWTPEGSPLIVYEQRLAKKLEAALQAAGRAAYVRIGMSYGPHSLMEAMEELRDLGCGELLVLPAYPQSAFCITGSVNDAYHRTLAKIGWDVPTRFISEYGSRAVYRQAVADSIREAGFDAAAGDRILFNFHSVPLKDISAGDTYLEQIDRDARDIAARLQISPDTWTIGYSCVFGPHPEKWSAPLSHDILPVWGREMARGEIRGRIFFTTPGFSVDCLETLWDTPQQLQPCFVKAGGDAERFVIVPPFNDSDRAVAVIADALFPTV